MRKWSHCENPSGSAVGETLRPTTMSSSQTLKKKPHCPIFWSSMKLNSEATLRQPLHGEMQPHTIDPLAVSHCSLRAHASIIVAFIRTGTSSCRHSSPLVCNALWDSPGCRERRCAEKCRFWPTKETSAEAAPLQGAKNRNPGSDNELLNRLRSRTDDPLRILFSGTLIYFQLIRC